MKRTLCRFVVLLVAVAAVMSCKDKKAPEGYSLGLNLSLPETVYAPFSVGVVVDGESYTQVLAGLPRSQSLVTSINLPGQVQSALSVGEVYPVYLLDEHMEVYSARLSYEESGFQGTLSQETYVGGDGTENNPYLIANGRQLENMMQLYAQAPAPETAGSFKYWFALVEDVLATDIANWIPLNNSGQFYKALDFDGHGHSIFGLHCKGSTYASFAGVLYGSIRNLVFDYASINADTKKGVVAGFLGTTGLPGSCENVRVVNSKVSGKNYSGGFAGQVRTTGTIVGCSVSGSTVASSSSYVGGFAGVMDIAGDDKYEVPARFVDCHVEDVVVEQNSTDAGDLYYTGGFIGGSVQAGSYKDCTVKATINATKAAVQSIGGFVGRTSYAGSNFQGCAVLPGTIVNAAGPRVGGFVGFAETADAYSQCTASATVSSAGDYAGGFAGYANGAAGFTECAFSGSVKGANYVGGFVGGASNASFRACNVSETALSAQSFLGGFVGELGDAAFAYDYAVFTHDGKADIAGAFAGKNYTKQASVHCCIGWDASLPFCGTLVSSTDFENNYAGAEGSVSSQAAANGWAESAWDFSGPLPLLKPGEKLINAIFVGDSITWQWGRNEGEYSKSKYPLLIPFNPDYMVDNGTTVTVKFHPGFFSRNGYIDKGISGQNTTQMKSRFEKDVINQNPVAVVIMAGTNDLAQGVTEDGIRNNIAEMADAAAGAGIKVVLCSVTPNNSKYSKLSDPQTKGAHIIKLNGLIQQLCAQKGYTYCDYWSALVAEDGLAMKLDYCLYDYLHPGPDGYDVMEPIIKGILDGLLK